MKQKSMWNRVCEWFHHTKDENRGEIEIVGTINIEDHEDLPITPIEILGQFAALIYNTAKLEEFSVNSEHFQLMDVYRPEANPETDDKLMTVFTLDEIDGYRYFVRIGDLNVYRCRKDVLKFVEGKTYIYRIGNANMGADKDLYYGLEMKVEPGCKITPLRFAIYSGEKVFMPFIDSYPADMTPWRARQLLKEKYSDFAGPIR